MVLAAIATVALAAETGMSDAEIRQRMIAESLAAYPGPCPCPDNTMKNGRRCGNFSAYSKPGGRSPLCYPHDVSQKMVDDYRQSHRLMRP